MHLQQEYLEVSAIEEGNRRDRLHVLSHSLMANTNIIGLTALISRRESSKGGILIPFQVQILTNFTYRVGYKPIFTSHESQLLIKGDKNQNTVIMDPNAHFFNSFFLLLLSLECPWGDLKGFNEQSRMWETCVSRQVFKLKTH